MIYMYKIIGHLNDAYYNEELDEYVEIKKVWYTNSILGLKIKVFIMQLFYDWVEIEECK